MRRDLSNPMPRWGWGAGPCIAFFASAARSGFDWWGAYFGLAGGGCIGLGEGDGDVAVKGGLCPLMPWL